MKGFSKMSVMIAVAVMCCVALCSCGKKKQPRIQKTPAKVVSSSSSRNSVRKTSGSSYSRSENTNRPKSNFRAKGISTREAQKQERKRKRKNQFFKHLKKRAGLRK